MNIVTVIFFVVFIFFIIVYMMEVFNESEKFARNIYSLFSYMFFAALFFGLTVFINNTKYDVTYVSHDTTDKEHISDIMEENGKRTIIEKYTKTCSITYYFDRTFVLFDKDSITHQYDTPCSKVGKTKLEEQRLKYTKEING